MKNNIIIFFTAAILAAVSTGCSVNEEGILGSFPYLELEVGTKAITKAASSEAVAVTTNRSLSVTVESPQGTWLKAVVEGDQLVLSWSQNELEIPREATVTVSTPNSLVTKTLAVTQDASGELTIREDLILHSKVLGSACSGRCQAGSQGHHSCTGVSACSGVWFLNQVQNRITSEVLRLREEVLR